MKKLIISLSLLIGLVALYFINVESNTVTVPYEAFKGGKIGTVNIEINGNIEKVSSGKINKLYWSADEGIETITLKENNYLFHTSYAVVDVNKAQTVTYTYTIDSIEGAEFNGSASDGTGVIFDNTVIPEGEEIAVGDIVEIVFPVDDHETFLSFKKL